MVKIGEVRAKGKSYYFLWYTDNINERIDFIRDPSDYMVLNTISCDCSYITGNPSKILGDRSILTKF